MMGCKELIDYRQCHPKRMVEDSPSSYHIDDRLEHVFGHFLKDFEIGILPEILGATFGQYGTFLPVNVQQNQSKNVRSEISAVPNGKAYWNSWKESANYGQSQINTKQIALTVTTDKIRQQDNRDLVAQKNQGSDLKRRNKLEIFSEESQASGCVMRRKELIDYQQHHPKCMVGESPCSYQIDERLEDVLGYFIKDFEMGILPEIMGSMFGQYGTFLSVNVQPNRSKNVRSGISAVPNGKAYWNSWKEPAPYGLSQTDTKQLGLTISTDKIRQKDHRNLVAQKIQGSNWKRRNKLEMTSKESQALIRKKRKELELPEATFKRLKSCSARSVGCKEESFVRFMQKA